MKTLWGSALATSTDEREMLSVPLLGERGVETVQKVPRAMLTSIIRPRIDEIFELVADRLNQCSGGASGRAAGGAFRWCKPVDRGCVRLQVFGWTGRFAWARPSLYRECPMLGEIPDFPWR